MRYSIGTKLILSYLLIVAVALGSSGALFYAFVKHSVQQQALDSLESEGQAFLKDLTAVDQNGTQGSTGASGSADDPNLSKRQKLRETHIHLSIAAQSTRAFYVLVNTTTQRILDTNYESVQRGEKFPFPIPQMDANDSIKQVVQVNKQQFLLYAAPLPKNKNGAVVLMAPLKIVHDVILGLIGTLIRGFLITCLVVVLLGWWLSRSLTKPVLVLGKQMRRIAKRDFSPPPVVETGDEFEEVSRTLAMMVSELKRYDQAQRRFLQNASHELKTPLMAIQGYAEGIKDGIFVEEEAQQGLDVISKESTRLKKLVDELIYLSKLETLEDVYNPSEQDLTAIIEDSLARVHSLALQKGIELKLRSPGPLQVRVDRDKMMQTMINLLSNGIRHAKSQVEVTVRQTGGKVHVVLHDDGEGFRDPQEQIFERFYKGDKGDTGLGLAIVKAIVEKSGGTITAGNAPSGGAEFHVELPLS